MTTSIWHLSGSTQFRKGKIELAVGAKVRFYKANTTTPLAVYRDSLATTPHDAVNLTTDGNAVWPAVFVPYGDFDFRVLDSDNTLIAAMEGVPNPAPIDTAATDPDALLQTGDVIWKPSSGSRSGFARCNGRTIGPGTSMATERANDDARDLFIWMWNNLPDEQAPVLGGRGSTASSDWAAAKPITLPDMRGSVPLGLDGMGNSPAGRLETAPVESGGVTTGGSVVGGNVQDLIEANLPSHMHAAGTLMADSAGTHAHDVGTYATANDGSHTHGVSDPGHSHSVTDYRTTTVIERNPQGPAYVAVFGGSQSSFSSGAAGTGVSINAAGTHTHALSGSSASSGAHGHTISGSSAATGDGTAHNNVSRSVLGTWFIKL